MNSRPIAVSTIAVSPGLVLLGLASVLSAQGAAPEPGTVEAHVHIAEGSGGFTGELFPWDSFGHSVAGLGDIDGDFVGDIIVGCPSFLPDPIFRGESFSRLYVLFLLPDGTVKGHTVIGDGIGGFDGDLAPQGHFGSSVAPLGDVDGDGVTDIVVGEQSANGFADFLGVGAVWLMHLHPDGTVKGKARKISMGMADFFFPLNLGDNFGVAVTTVGDLDGNGMVDIAVGANGDDGPVAGPQHANFGAVYILFLEPTGLVINAMKIGMGQGGFPAPLMPGDFFGTSLASIPDITGTGVITLLVGAPGDDDGGSNRGAVWKLSLMPDGTVSTVDKISALSGNLPSTLADFDSFGRSISSVGDLDGNGSPQFAVGSPGEDALSENTGSIHMVFLDNTGDVEDETIISVEEGDFDPGPGEPNLRVTALAVVEDISGDGADEMAVGSVPPTPAGNDRGSVYLLMLHEEIATPLSTGPDCDGLPPARLRLVRRTAGHATLSMTRAGDPLPLHARAVLFATAGGVVPDSCAPDPLRLRIGSFAAGATPHGLDVDLPPVPGLVGRDFAVVGAFVTEGAAGETNAVRVSLLP